MIEARKTWHPWVTVVVTMVAVAVVSKTLPLSAEATAAAFLVPVWFWVWRHDDSVVKEHGLALGGLMLHERRGAASGSVRALVVFVVVAGVVLVPYAFVYRRWHHMLGPIHWASAWQAVVRDSPLAQLLTVALPEEAFFRGYLQTAFDRQFTARVRIFGAHVGLSLVVTSAIFAIGHLITVPHPQRLAVFVPSLLFGWMRARTGGIGASMAFHALCNLMAAALERGLTPG